MAELTQNLSDWLARLSRTALQAYGAGQKRYSTYIYSASLRAGSVCLNSMWAVAKWILALVMLQPGLAAAR